MIGSANRLSMISHQVSKQFSTQKTINNIDILSNDTFAKITLNKPKALNSLSTEMVKDITSQLSFIDSHKAFWMQGAGGKAFCAGGDVKALFVNGASVNDRVNFFKTQYQMDYKISQLKALQIANWDGIVMGGGVGISAFSPFIIATQNSMYAMPQGKIGFFTDVAAGYFLSRLRNNIGYYLGLTGARLKGQQLYVAGLANFYIPRQNIQKVYDQIHQGLSSAKQPKQFVHNVLSKYHKSSGKKQLDNQSDINAIFSKQTVYEIFETVKHSDQPFYKQVKKMLQQQCPLSVHLSHRSIKLSRHRNLRECFLQDFILAQHLSVNQNFSQGVRCLLIDKGQVPKWTDKHLMDVPQHQVAELFQAPKNGINLQI